LFFCCCVALGVKFAYIMSLASGFLWRFLDLQSMEVLL
jgi:hypothetical protein